MLAGGPEAGGDEQGADFVAVQPGGVRLVVDAGPADMHRRGVGDETFFLGVAVEAGHGAEPTGDGRCRPPLGLELSAEGLDVAAADLEQPEVTVLAEGDELAQVQGVGVAGQPPRNPARATCSGSTRPGS